MPQESLSIRFNTACEIKDEGTAGTMRKNQYLYPSTQNQVIQTLSHLLSTHLMNV